MTRILVVGETILDMTPGAGGLYQPVPGGSAFNTARALGALGANVAFAGAVSRDAWGGLFRAALADAGVDCALLRASDAPMPLALVSAESAAGPAFTLYTEGTAHAHARAPEDLPEGVAHLHVSSFHACTAPTGAGVLALMARGRGRASVSFDPNVRPGVLPGRGEAAALIEARVRLADIVKASAQDMEWLYPDRAPLAAMQAWSHMGPRLAILTRGADGASAFGAGECVSVPAPSVCVADSVGAGDAFTAALLAEMAREGALGPHAPAPGAQALGRWLAFACAAAAWTCARRGAQAPTRADIAALAAP